MGQKLGGGASDRRAPWVKIALAMFLCLATGAYGFEQYRIKTAREQAAVKLRSAEALVVSFVRAATGEISRIELAQRGLSTCEQLATLTASIDREAVSGTPGLHAAANAYGAAAERFVRGFSLTRASEADLSSTFEAFKKVDMDAQALTAEALKGFFGLPSVALEHVALKKAVSEQRANLKSAYVATAESADRLAQASTAIAGLLRDEAFGQEVDLPRIARWAADEAAQMPK